MPAAPTAPTGGSRTHDGRRAAMLCAVLAVLAAGGLAPGAGARTYYASPAGSDGHSGLSPSRPWRTVARVNRARLRPGDRVLLRGGAVFTDLLMPSTSGRPGARIVFASYGGGRARLPRGVWFRGRHDLGFDHLAVSGDGFVGRGHRIGLTNSVIAHTEIGVFAVGTAWWIAGNHVHDIGDSGLILTGQRMVVMGNRIERTGLDPSIDYGKHGIYLKVIDAHVAGNVIRRFADEGVSVRYRNSVVEGNEIAEGPIGIAWYQYDRRAGVSSWAFNSVAGTTAAGIYVSKTAWAGRTRESFVIRANLLHRRSGLHFDLGRTSGFYRLLGNQEA